MSGRTVGSAAKNHEIITATNRREWIVLPQGRSKARVSYMIQSEFWIDDERKSMYRPPTMTGEQAEALNVLITACSVSALKRWNRGVMTTSPSPTGEYFFIHIDPAHEDQVLGAVRGILTGDLTAGDDFVAEMRAVVEAPGSKFDERWIEDLEAS